MKYFPEIENYNIDTPSGMACYCAHMDLDPIGGLIESTRISTGAFIKMYGEIANSADDNNDFQTSSDAMNELTIFSARIVPLEYQSILLIMMSYLEEAFNTWCKAIEIQNDKLKTSIPSFESFSKQKRIPKAKLEKAFAFLREFAFIEGITNDLNWDYISAIRIARNSIVHNGGRVKNENERNKLKKHEIGMREEDYVVYIDHDTLIKMHKIVIAFVDRTFAIKPSH